MADVVTKQVRSRMMAGILSRNTKPELIVRKALHARGFRYSLHPARLIGKPDIVLKKWQVVIFVHGCFWHWHGCLLSKLPSSNTAFWGKKLISNRARDDIVIKKLIGDGWRVVTIWECAIRGKPALEQWPELLDLLEQWIRKDKNASFLEIDGTLIGEGGGRMNQKKNEI